jgi:glycerol-3-phosphate acyltransferase PlsY
MIDLAIKFLLAYLLGSVSGSLLLGSLRGVDIRDSGSGNAGGTNAFRTQGLFFALGVVIIDIGKGALAAWWLPALQLPAIASSLPQSTLAIWCGCAAVLGHCYPLYHGFRGGKGAGTLVGVLAVVATWSLLPMLFVWLIVLALSGYVGLATMAAGFGMFAAILIQSDFQVSALSVFAGLMAIFLVFTHRSNIGKLRSGTEYRFERAWYKNWIK